VINEKIKVGYDDNLGLPSDFSVEMDCDIVPFHDLATLTDAFAKKELAIMFIPAGTLPFVKEYEIISQSLFGVENSVTLSSIFVTTQDITITDIPNCTIGRINRYCTTSFWAPMISLMYYLPKNTKLIFKEANGFQDLLHETAKNEIDCCMIWDIYLKKNPNDAAKVRSLFTLSHLPSPIMLAQPGLGEATKQKINAFRTTDPLSLFRGFQAPVIDDLKHFMDQMKAAAEYFDIHFQLPTV
jgi:hypothetical protein